MGGNMATILSDTGAFAVDASDGLCVSVADAERVSGWTLKPEGMCRGDLCVPLRAGMRRDERIDLPEFWRALGNLVIHNAREEVWVLGAGADERNATLAGLEAPDFTLPDLEGKPLTLSELRGRKVFLCTWASW
jgi:hypothetical protein